MVPFKGKQVKVGDQLGPKATLVVNVASYCALTPQYKDLVQLWDLYHDQGLQILAMPCNQFGQQEPEADVDVIRKDMKARFNVQFPIFDKIDVNGATTHPLYAAMKSYEPELSGYGPKVNWNFEKFLLDASGTPVRRYRPGVLVTDPTVLDDVAALIKKGKLSARKKATSVNNY
ncbi:glutathione peroxidase [Tribonema minus]|uniref:Glutathione peroxidase n=1 Tax=Tribonema minus TaxID=303371 RepID=A0A835ZB32_9STRA|nr:glutathione peroxidase [Tribonema minus]